MPVGRKDIRRDRPHLSSVAVERELSGEMLADLLRSAWIVEAARAAVYEGWARSDRRFEASAHRARRRAGILAGHLERRGRAPDAPLVEPHAVWIRKLAGASAPDPLGDIFVVRLGDWVEGHAGPFLDEGAEDLRSLGEEERAGISIPAELPDAPPLEPVRTIDVEPPGETKLRFGILGDIHIGSTRGEDMARAAIAELNRSGAELVIQLGDLTDRGERGQFETATKVLAELQMPYATMIGNHDVFSYEEQRLSGPEYYPEAFGRAPDGVVLEHEGVRFAVLDSAEIGASPFSPFDLVTGTFMEGPGGAVVRGAFTPPMHDILAQVAEPGAPPAFVFLHHPPQPFTSFPPVIFGLRDEDTARLHATCDSGNVWGVFAGHTHRNARTRDFGGIPAQEVAIPRDFPCGYALVDVTDRGYAYRFVQISDEDLLYDAYRVAGTFQRRYALGDDHERAFTWESRGTRG